MAPTSGVPEILSLVASLTDRSSAALQVKINTYLATKLQAGHCFQAFLSKQDEEVLQVQVIGDTCLEDTVTIPVDTPYIKAAVTGRGPSAYTEGQPGEEEFVKTIRFLYSQKHGALEKLDGSLRLTGLTESEAKCCQPGDSAPKCVGPCKNKSMQGEDAEAGILKLFPKPKSFLCVPVFIPEQKSVSSANRMEAFDIIAVLLCIVDFPMKEKNVKDSPSLSPGVSNTYARELKCVDECFKYTLPLLTTTLAYEAQSREHDNSHNMLAIAQKLFVGLRTIDSLLQVIMMHARKLTHAKMCSLFLVEDSDLVAKVFDGETDKRTADGRKREIRFPCDKGIAGRTYMSGKLCNIKDAYSDPDFYRDVDAQTGSRTTSMLCFPIFGDDKKVIGVAELCNKQNGRYFTKHDERLATTYSVYCGIALSHSILYDKVHCSHVRSKLCNELLLGISKDKFSVDESEVNALVAKEIPPPTQLDKNFLDFSYFPRELPEENSALGVLTMFNHLGVIKQWNIEPASLANFVLMVRNGYRKPPYHNWTHAFSVTHFACLLLNNLNLVQNKAITSLEAFALLVSCLCHDLDHRGTTNSFQLKSNSMLASLYSSEGSVMERHHLAQAICILNKEECNILKRLSREEYGEFFNNLRDLILATDVADHLKKVKEMRKMTEEGYNPANETHKSLLLSLLVTSADLSDQTKNWNASRKTAKLIYKEFFSEGDLEKAMESDPPLIRDRERAFIPELQLSFLKNIAIPVYELLSQIFPGADVPYLAAKKSEGLWKIVNDKYIDSKSEFKSSMDIFDKDLDHIGTTK